LLKKVLSLVLAIICSYASAAAQAPAPATPAKSEASFDERLGEDDGAALAILFGANLRGNLDPCD
jgi:hypothetical protein